MTGPIATRQAIMPQRRVAVAQFGGFFNWLCSVSLCSTIQTVTASIYSLQSPHRNLGVLNLTAIKTV
jgi:hypothetical protein